MSKMHTFYMYIFQIWTKAKRRRNGCIGCTLHVAGCNECSRYLDADHVNEKNNYSFNNSNTVAEDEQFEYKSNTYALQRQSDVMKIQSGSRMQNQRSLRSIRSNIVLMEMKHQFGTQGSSGSQLDSPAGFCLNMDGHIVVTDTNNECIKLFDKTGTLLKRFGFRKSDFFPYWYPYKIVQMSTGDYLICEEYGDITRLSLLKKQDNFPEASMCIGLFGTVVGLAINRHEDILVLVETGCAIFCYDKDLVFKEALFLDQFIKRPLDLAVHNDEYFVCDSGDHCIIVINELGNLLRIIKDENIIKAPIAIDISCNGQLLIASRNENGLYVTMFSTEGIFKYAYECPQTKVSSFFSLKISKDGSLVIVDEYRHRIYECTTHSRTYVNFIIRGMRELKGGLPPPNFY